MPDLKKKTIIAICYDFDKTLSPDDMQSQGFIQSIHSDVGKFWQESNGLAKNNDMDQNLAYMYLMATKSRGRHVFNKKMLMDYGAKLKLFPGVSTWFKRIDTYAKRRNVVVEHYIISSGLKEMIEGNVIAPHFKKIYASSFYYDDAGIAVWPAQVVNYTNKTQFLFRIEKGILDVNDQRVNDFYPPEEIRIPFRNIVYIGDSDTDVPCMKLVNLNGGYSIGVYNSETKDKTKVYKMMNEHRIRYFMPADYTKESLLEDLIHKIIDRTQANEVLETAYYNAKNEAYKQCQSQSDEEKEKETLISALEDSQSFAQTNNLISTMTKMSNWTVSQKNKLIDAALLNQQVKFYLKNDNARKFFDIICQGINNERAKELLEMIEKIKPLNIEGNQK